MAKIKLNKQNRIDIPTLFLQNKNFHTLGKIINPQNLTYKENLNSANELSFTVHKEWNGTHNPLWEQINTNKVLYIPEFAERFIIKVPISEEMAPAKNVIATSLCENELSGIKLYNVEINTPDDIAREDSARHTVFFDEDNPDTSLLHRLLQKAPHYSIAHVDDSLKDKWEILSISDKSIHEELVGEISEKFNCIFLFNSMYDSINDSAKRTISAYDLDTYGEDTTIFITNENLATQINLEPDSNALINCFYVEGGDDIINAAIRSINPNGSNYIYYFDESARENMSSDLNDALTKYDTLYQEYNSTTEYYLDTDSVEDYNSQVKYVIDTFGTDNDITKSINTLPPDGILTGYPATTTAMYEAINLYYFLKTSMMPSIDTSVPGLNESLNAVIDGFRTGFTNQIALPYPDLSTQSDVERAVQKTAGIFFGTAYYTLTIQTSNYIQATKTALGKWTGTFKLTSLTKTDANGNKESVTSDSITLTIIERDELYIQQEISRALSNKDKLSQKNLADFSMSETDFNKQLLYYSFDELQKLSDMFKSCQDVLTQTKSSSNIDNELLEKYNGICSDRLEDIALEKQKRQQQLESVKVIYNPDSSDISKGLLHQIRTEVNDNLNFENYICPYHSNLWKEFCSYRREDKYSDSNSISDGLNDSQIIESASKLLADANEALVKSGTLQYSISTTMNNLLGLKEFKAFAEHFSVGNRIQVRVDQCIYTLRLLSYQTDFDNLESINVEFSTVLNTSTGYSDVKSIIESASSMAASYSGLIKQVEKTTSTADKVNRLVSNGLNATRTKFVDSDEEEIVINNHGILARHYDSITNDYDKCQCKILGNGLYTTSDNWETINAGIGRISYFDPKKNEQVEDYGIIAKTVVGNLFIGEELRIYGKENCVTIDENGITLDGGAITWNSPIKKSAVEGLENSLSTFVEKTLYNEDIDKIQKQIDGNITTWFYDYLPTSSNKPASDWTTDAEKITHEGDLFYCTNSENAHAYRYVYNDTTKQHQWLLIEDTDVTKALADAAVAQDTADSKRRVFVTTPEPPYDEGDLWTQGDKGELMRCKNGVFRKYGETYDILSDWEKATKYTDDSELISYKEEISSFQTSVNNTLSTLNGAVPVTKIGDDYIISPKIGGGYLYITNEDYSIEIDPNHSAGDNTLDGYLFSIRDKSRSDEQVIMGVDTSGKGYFNGGGTFSGDIKLNYLDTYNAYDFVVNKDNGINFGYHNGYKCYNFIINKNGLKLGVGDGGTRYALVIDNAGNITSMGSFNLSGVLNVGNKLTYSDNNGLVVTDSTIKNSKLLFVNSENETAGELYCDNSSYIVNLISNHVNIESLHGSIRLNAGTFVHANSLVVGSIDNPNNGAHISSNSITLFNDTNSMNISCNSVGNCVITNSNGTSVGVVNDSFSPLAEQTEKISLGRPSVKWSNIYSVTSSVSSSDRSLKKDISPISEKYELLFMKLMPVSYLFKDGTSGRTHIGFISQDVESAMMECGLSDLEFAGFCKDKKLETYIDENGMEHSRDVLDENGNPVYAYSLRYEEFIALNTHILQKCINKIDTLENRIENIEREMA